MTPLDVIPFWSDTAFKAALVALVVALTGLVGWLMRERKTAKDSANLPGTELRRKADDKLRHLEGEVKALTDGLDALNDKADDLATGIEHASDRIQDIDQKVNDAATEVAKLSTDMEWVKKALDAISKKLGV
jgi:X-X-X-Leu-X-X-Gly heptad repeat protein